MTNAPTKERLPRNLDYYDLKNQAEEFLYEEAELLDQRHFREWLDLFTEDLVYFMPIRRNVKFGEHSARENTREEQDINWFEEDKWTLSKRVEQIMTGVHWSEEPLSRVCHMVSNVQIVDVTPSLDAPSEMTVRSRFLIYQNRVEYESYFFVGKRLDRLRKENGMWKNARREIILDQNVLLAKNLTVFF
ncbi:MAG: 3-phenylpropionate/cinnamic acid dioxygenase subunit beta [Alphaproteobacteria bacterium]|nr:3-phenylpropionate/cinnamic acid dioxygenase subunit beta [Alphaproteobacteria bacterium]